MQFLFTFIWISYMYVKYLVRTKQSWLIRDGAGPSPTVWQKWLILVYTCLHSNKSCGGKIIKETYIPKYHRLKEVKTIDEKIKWIVYIFELEVFSFYITHHFFLRSDCMEYIIDILYSKGQVLVHSLWYSDSSFHRWKPQGLCEPLTGIKRLTMLGNFKMPVFILTRDRKTVVNYSNLHCDIHVLSSLNKFCQSFWYK